MSNIPPVFNFTNYFRRNKGHGNGLIVKGGVRKGKTTTVSLLTKQLLDKTNFNIISNVRFQNSVYDKYPRLFYITSDYEYFNYYQKTPDDTPSLLVWDDIQASEGFQSTSAHFNDNLQSFLVFIGKLETSFIYVAHRTYIPEAIKQGFEPIYLHKLDRASFYITLDDYPRASEVKKAVQMGQGYYVPLPKWETLQSQILPILSRGIAGFEFIIDHSELYKYLRRYDIGEDLKRGIREYLQLDGAGDSEAKDIAELKAMSYERILLALMLKRERLISGGEKIRQVINPSIVQEARDKASKLGIK